MLCALLLLANCSGPDCVMADDWGQNQDIAVPVPAVDELTDSGIAVTAGAPLYIKPIASNSFAFNIFLPSKTKAGLCIES